MFINIMTIISVKENQSILKNINHYADTASVKKPLLNIYFFNI